MSILTMLFITKCVKIVRATLKMADMKGIRNVMHNMPQNEEKIWLKRKIMRKKETMHKVCMQELT